MYYSIQYGVNLSWEVIDVCATTKQKQTNNTTDKVNTEYRHYILIVYTF